MQCCSAILQMGEDEERPNGQAQAEQSEEDPEAAALELWTTVSSAVPYCSRDLCFDVHALCSATGFEGLNMSA